MASGNPPSYSRPFHPLHSLTVGETHFTFLTRIEQTLIWIPYALFLRFIYSFISLHHLYSTRAKDYIFFAHLFTFKDVQLCVCGRVHIYVYVILWVACFNALN